MDQQILAEAVTVIAPISQHGFGGRDRQLHQGVCGFVVRDLASGKDKAKRAPLIVTSGMDLARKAAA
ncbi:hypothetical protein GCM10010937_00610 [Gluconobacter japonicus]|uniref:Uncharacterized protein n=1 Tax=Gluconobacter japonicus TaxID=376620 RepID=A0ABQ5WFB8_GLUJA|nr:hypothetical protein GCM10010937_00610 [Gluconobacter japonicus]